METATSPRTLGERLRERRDAQHLSLRKLAQRVNNLIPEYGWINDETLRRIETGETPADKVDPVRLGYIAHVLGCTVFDLSPEKADEFERVLPLVGQAIIRCKRNCAGQLALLELVAS